MSISAIVGANWGDEGKGKMTDCLAGKADIVIRFQGGANAGHTIINDYGKFALHLLPSGIFQKNTVNIIGTGVALDIKKLLVELSVLKKCNIPTPSLFISDRTQVMMPYHILLDEYEEDRRGDNAFGSTKVGIAPFYSDTCSKLGIQVCDLFNKSVLESKIKDNIEIKNILFSHLYNKPKLIVEEIVTQALILGESIKDMIIDSNEYITNAINGNKNILLEGQLGALRDPNNGIYPWVTSSSTLAGFGSVGAGVPPWKIDNIVAVTKAYSSCVGAGPFVTELGGETGTWLRENGGDSGEYGATTGRARRVGFFDSVATKYGCKIQGATTLALTNLDVLSPLEEIPVCDKYVIDGELISVFPTTGKVYKAKPVWKILDGWESDIRGINNYNKLPDNAKRYIDYIQYSCDTQIKYISTGSHRDALIQI